MTTTTTRGLFATLEAAPGKEEELELLLVTAQSIVEAEPGTTTWFALRMGRGEYGIFDAFPDDAGRTFRTWLSPMCSPTRSPLHRDLHAGCR
ncbi:MAG: hypothetical protein ACT4PW_11520 [Acidimicrobiia bacterium]